MLVENAIMISIIIAFFTSKSLFQKMFKVYIRLKSYSKYYVSLDAELISDKWKGYTPLINEFTKLKQVASTKGKNFKELHIPIRNSKGLLKRNSSSL